MGRIKNIFVPGQIPSPTSFKTDDIIINPIDGKVYIKNTKNTTIEIGRIADSASFATSASHAEIASALSTAPRAALTASEVILIANNVPGVTGTHNVLLGSSAGDSSRIAFDAQITHNTVTNGLRVGTDAVKGSITASSILIEDGISLFISNSHLTSANILDLQTGKSIASDGKFASPISGDESFTFMKSSEAGKIGLFATGSTIARFIIKGDPSPSAIFNVHITASGDISASGDFTAASITTDTITATKIIATQFTTSIITSSVIQTEGSNILGDAISDTQTFNGHITASGNISASDTMIMLTASIGGGIFTSASLASDNLGNHTATQNLDMATFNIINAGDISGTINGGTF